MTVDEALDNIVVNSEEKKSIENYVGPFHTRMNLLVNLTPKNYEDLHEFMPKTSKELEQRIMEFVNIYSVMLKSNTKSENLSNKNQLVRGTSVQRINEMGKEPCSFLSLTNDKEIAQRFTIRYKASKKGAFLRFKLADGIPYIDTSKYLKNDLGEKEIILSPFCNIISKKLIGQEFGIDEYIVEMEPPNLQEIPKEQLQSTLNEVILGYEQNIKDIEELNWIKGEIDRLFLVQNQAKDIEDKIFIKEEIEKNEAKRSKLEQSTNAYKEKLQTVLKGLCKQKEIEITSARKFLEQEKAKQEEARRLKVIQDQEVPKKQEQEMKPIYKEARIKRNEKMTQMKQDAKQQLTSELQGKIWSNRK